MDALKSAIPSSTFPSALLATPRLRSAAADSVGSNLIALV
jgi:hypothetical protein